MAGGDWKEMFEAIQHGCLGLVRNHIRMGIDPNYQHPEFMTTLLIERIRQEQIEIARFLLTQGANPILQEDWDKDTPLSVAKRSSMPL